MFCSQIFLGLTDRKLVQSFRDRSFLGVLFTDLLRPDWPWSCTDFLRGLGFVGFLFTLLVRHEWPWACTVFQKVGYRRFSVHTFVCNPTCAVIRGMLYEEPPMDRHKPGIVVDCLTQTFLVDIIRSTLLCCKDPAGSGWKFLSYSNIYNAFIHRRSRKSKPSLREEGIWW